MDPDGVVVAGNGTLQAAVALGWTEIRVVRTALGAKERAAFAVADNQTGLTSEWDEEALVRQLGAMDADLLAAVGFDEAELARLIPPPPVEDPGPGEPPVAPISRIGDLWILGEHRLLCGDSTKADDVLRVMADEKAVLLSTDPPYLVDYEGGNHPESWSNRPEVRDKRWDAYVDPGKSQEFFSAWLSAWLSACVEAVPVYQWHATRRQSIVEKAWEQCGLLLHQTIVWVKARPVLTRSHYMWQHEPCFYGWPKGKQPKRRPPPNERNVWSIDQRGESDGIHPTQKPLEIFERPIRFHTVSRDLIAEPFSGSGTQIIAAEKLGRRCRAIEISPAFVDVAVRRWEKATGRSATLDGDGRTFAQVAAERLPAK